MRIVIAQYMFQREYNFKINLNMSICIYEGKICPFAQLIKQHAIKICEGVNMQLHKFGEEQSASCPEQFASGAH
jgi:hypothetical protein